ncbi:hypothetical protein [Streptococcus suis]|uniref:hypothetical protein n=1 Tax=Streptococcus suis TaxID=1307 RepID=UPI001ABEB763|nr:hypothetical protein [Streptococcus suis]
MSMFKQIVSKANKASEETINVTAVNLGSVATPYKDYVRDENGQKIKDNRGYDKKEDKASKLKYQFSTVGQECKTVTLLAPIDKPLTIEPLVVYEITAYGYSFKNGGYWLTELVTAKPLLQLKEVNIKEPKGEQSNE